MNSHHKESVEKDARTCCQHGEPVAIGSDSRYDGLHLRYEALLPLISKAAAPTAAFSFWCLVHLCALLFGLGWIDDQAEPPDRMELILFNKHLLNGRDSKNQFPDCNTLSGCPTS